MQIGVLKWRSEFQEIWVDRASTIPTIIIYTMQIIGEFTKCLKRARQEEKPLREILWAKRWFWL